jgi:predicted MFS family arabinose efflux permease
MSNLLSKVKLPYLLLLPGFLFLFTFFILPIVNLAQTSTQTPIVGGDTGQYEQTLQFSNYITAFTENKEQFARLFIFALCATVLALAIAGFGQHDRTLVTIGLFLLGLGWSAATVAASALLSKTLPTDEKTNVQGFSDMSMNLAGAFGGAISGSILASIAFLGLNAAAFIPVAIIVIFSAVARLKRDKTA